MPLGQRFYAWGDQFFYDYPKACIFEKDGENTAVEINNEVRGCWVLVDKNDTFDIDVLSSPQWLKDVMKASRERPAPTIEKVERQLEASRLTRESTIEELGVLDEKGRLVIR